MDTFDLAFFQNLAEQLSTISDNSKSIPAQMCGEAALALRKLIDEGEQAKMLAALHAEIAGLKELINKLEQKRPASVDHVDWVETPRYGGMGVGIGGVEYQVPWAKKYFIDPLHHKHTTPKPEQK